MPLGTKAEVRKALASKPDYSNGVGYLRIVLPANEHQLLRVWAAKLGISMTRLSTILIRRSVADITQAITDGGVWTDD